MKTLILFGTKHGSSMRAAKMIATKIRNFDLIDIKEKQAITLEDYDTVYIGCPIYFGNINKGIKKFLQKNQTELLTKDLKLFTLGLDDKNIKKTLSHCFNNELLEHATHKHLGGAYVFEEMSFLERFIVKKVARFTESVDMISEEAITELING